MKIVIDIPEDDFYMMQRVVEMGIGSSVDKLICSGTPLPKGHGRLIDADSIYQIVRPVEQSDVGWGMTAETAIRLIHEAFNRAPTIIEADNSESGEV